jgi:hypothetical protein
VIDLEQFAWQSPYSDPGRHADALAAVPSDIESLCATSRNVIAHYRAELPGLAPERRGEIDSRWLEVILDIDQERHGSPLDTPRPLTERVAGCCRDHSLMVVGALRQRDVPARNRVGFAHYFAEDWDHDHVVVEFWRQGRWVRADPELHGLGFGFDVRDIPAGPAAPFETAAEAWLGWRSGDRDLSTYGVMPNSDLCGPGFVRSYVIFEIAHRYRDEMLLWDDWGATNDAGDEPKIDELARLLVAADHGDDGAEAELFARYREDPQLRPGDTVTTHSPYGDPPRTVKLRR